MAENDDFLSDEDLEQMLGNLASQVPAPSDALMSRVLDDAENHRQIPGAHIRAENSNDLFGILLSVLGGWKGAGGLVTACVLGLYIGVSPPTSLETTTTGIWDIISPDVTGGWSEFDDFL